MAEPRVKPVLRRPPRARTSVFLRRCGDRTTESTLRTPEETRNRFRLWLHYKSQRQPLRASIVHLKQTAALIHGVQSLFESGAIGQQTDGELLRQFCERRDQRADHAFAALVERHGPMVLRVCRSILRNEHDAQDAFQATFLILVRRSHSVRNRESIGSWLYGVALRVAACARASLARRRELERRVAALWVPSGPDVDAGRREITAIIHEELGRLPERCRAVLLLCHLEGLTCEAAACQLGWPIGTVKSRLSRGRELLLRRLIRRGLGPDDASNPRQPHCATLPAALLRDTVQAMCQLVGPQQVSDLVSLHALYCARKVLSGTQITRAVLTPSLLLAGVIAAAGAAFALPRQEPSRTRCGGSDDCERRRAGQTGGDS